MDHGKTPRIEFSLNAAHKIAGLTEGGPFVDIEIEQRPAIRKLVAVSHPRPGMCRVEVGVGPVGIVTDQEDIEGRPARREMEAFGDLDRVTRGGPLAARALLGAWRQLRWPVERQL